MKGSRYERRTANQDSEDEDDGNEENDAPFALAGLYVLKVLLIDMTISLGDVGTDFWQVIKHNYVSSYLKINQSFHLMLLLVILFHREWSFC